MTFSRALAVTVRVRRARSYKGLYGWIFYPRLARCAQKGTPTRHGSRKLTLIRIVTLDLQTYGEGTTDGLGQGCLACRNIFLSHAIQRMRGACCKCPSYSI